MKFIRISAVFVFLVILAVLGYANSLHCPFVYDDYLTVVDNDSIRDITNLRWIFLFYVTRPLLNFSFAFNYWLGGLDPFGYHIFNLVTHIANVYLLFLLVYLFFQERSKDRTSGFLAALFPALIFAVHPLFTEAVTYTTSRSSLLSAFFYLLAFLCLTVFTRSESKRTRGIYYLAAFASFFLGLLTKEEIITFPAVILLYDYLFGEKNVKLRSRFWKYHWPFWAVLLVGGIARLIIFFRMEASHNLSSIYLNFLTQLNVSLKYLGLLILPTNLNFIHDYPPGGSLTDFYTLVSIVTILAILIFAWRMRSRFPGISFLAFSFFIILSPYFLIPLNEAMSEHRAYLPGICYCLGLGMGLAMISQRGEAGGKIFWKIFSLIIAGVLTLVFLYSTIQRNRVWESEVTLFKDALQKSPHSPRARDGLGDVHYGLGDAYRNSGQYEQAIKEYETSLAIKPDNLDSWVNLGISYGQIGNLEKAEEAFKKVLSLDPKYVKALNDLGVIAVIKNQKDLAISRFSKVLRLDPENFVAHKHLGDLYFKDDPKKSLNHYQMALKAKPFSSLRDEILNRIKELDKP